MAGQTELGRAQVAIRASLDELDGDLADGKKKITSVLGNVAGGLAGVVGGVFAAGAGASVALGKLATDAAPLQGISGAFAGIADDATSMLAALREGSSGMVTDVDLMKSYNQAAQLVGESFANQLPDAMGYLGKVAASTGQDVGFMLDSLVKGVGRLSPMILDNLGIQVNMADAAAAWAEETGFATTSVVDNSEAMAKERDVIEDLQTQLAIAQQRQSEFKDSTAESTKMSMEAKIADLNEQLAEHNAELAQLGLLNGTVVASTDDVTASMTKAQQQEALMAAVMKQLATNTADMPDVTDTAAAKMAQLRTTMDNLKAEMGTALLPALTAVMTPLAELAETYGPMLSEAFGQVAEMLGPMVGGAVEALVPLVTELLDALIPLGLTIMEQLMPAFSAILEASVGLAGVLLEALAPVFSTLLEALLPVITELVDMLAPILVQLISGLLPPLMPLIEGLAQIFLRLAEALLPVVSTLLEQLTPILVELADTLIPPLTIVLLALADIFVQLIEAVLPIFTELLELIMPVVEELADLIAEGLSIALTALGGIVEEVGKGLDWFREHVLQPVLEVFEKVKKAIDGVVQWLRTLKDQLDGLELPGWLTPGSPTPLELGLVGIGDQLRRVSGLMGGLNAQMSLEAVTAGGGRTWNGDVIINGAANPEATAAAVLRALRSRGMMTATALR